MAPAVLLSYLATQRRAAFLSLGIALVFVFVFIYRQHRTLFWMITPVVLLFGAAYLGVFWNSESPLAMPASAVRSIVAPDITGKDYESNLYRMIENVNVSQTIHDVPLTGVGFGNKLHIIVPMPDISFFIWWEYIVHNSVLWFWIKTGVVGFLSMLFLVGFGIMNAARAALGPSERTASGGDTGCDALHHDALSLCLRGYVMGHAKHAVRRQRCLASSTASSASPEMRLPRRPSDGRGWPFHYRGRDVYARAAAGVTQ